MKKVLLLAVFALAVTRAIEFDKDGHRVEVVTIEKDGHRIVLTAVEAEQVRQELPGGSSATSNGGTYVWPTPGTIRAIPD